MAESMDEEPIRIDSRAWTGDLNGPLPDRARRTIPIRYYFLAALLAQQGAVVIELVFRR